MCGFFQENIEKRLLDVDYFIGLGTWAYRSLSSEDTVLSEIFDELDRKFVEFVDVLAEIKEKSFHRATDKDLLRWYEQYLKTGSQRLRQRLIEFGINPISSLPRRPQ